MIRVLQRGVYKVISVSTKERLILLDNQFYQWDMQKQLLKKGHVILQEKTQFLQIGAYRIYFVDHELHLTDGIHLEICIDASLWQGFVLPDNLPAHVNEIRHIEATQEVISNVTEKSIAPFQTDYV